MRIRISMISVSLALLAISAFSQIMMTGGSSRIGPDGQWTATATFGGNGMPQHLPFAIKGAPYSGVEISQRVQTLADGTNITQNSPSKQVYRDSSGRTRTERPFFPVSSVKNLPYIVEIVDPVAGQSVILDTINKVAHLTILQKPPMPALPKMASPAPNTGVATTMIPGARRIAGERPQISTERLGAKTIDGIVVEGTRTTTTHPAGTMGNDRPITSTSEIWMSPELKIVVFTKMSDPRSGDNITALTKISRAEPDPALFQIPQGYRVVEETGSFSITVSGH